MRLIALLSAAALTFLSACGAGGPKLQFTNEYEFGQTLPTASAALRVPGVGDSPGGSPNAELQQMLAAKDVDTNVIVTFDDVTARVNVRYFAGRSGTPHESNHASTDGTLIAYFNDAHGPRADLNLTFNSARLHNPSDNPNDDGEVDVLESLQVAHVPVDVFSEQYAPLVEVTPSEWFSEAFDHIHSREFETLGQNACGRYFDCDLTLPKTYVRMNGEDWREGEGVGTLYHSRERGYGAARIHVDDIGNPGANGEAIGLNGGVDHAHPNAHGRGYGFDIYVRTANAAYPDEPES